MSSSRLIEQFLRAHGRLGALHAGTAAIETKAEGDEARLRSELMAIANSSRTMVWAIFALTSILACVGLGIAAALGGSALMSSLSAVSAGLCLPIAAFLRALWREKVRIEVLLTLLPCVPPEHRLDALERFLAEDKTPAPTPTPPAPSPPA